MSTSRNTFGGRRRPTWKAAFGVPLALLSLLLAGCADITAEDRGSTSLKGETLDLVVPYEPGGGYDIYARMLSPYLEDCLGATVVVRNEPGAGGLLATNKTYVASPDEHRVLLANTVGLVSSQLGKVAGARYSAAKLSWLGRISAEPSVLVVASDSEYGSFAEMRRAEKPVRFVATGPGSNEYANSAVLPEVYGFPAKTITGFDGSEPARAAVLAGDADAHILPLDSQIEAIEAGDVKPLLVIGDKPHEAIPDVPTVADFPVEPGQEPVLTALVELVETGRTLVGSSQLDPAQVKTLRHGLACALRDKKLLAEAEKQQRDIDPLSGAESAKTVRRALESPAEFKKLVK